MILKNTPSWVFVLFFALVALGYFLSRDRTIGRSRLVITPVAMTALSLYGVLSSFGTGSVGLMFWMAGVVVVVWLGVKLASPRGVSFLAETKSFFVPGSWLPLALMMAIFFTKYAMAAVQALRFPVVSEPVFIGAISLCYGVFSGVFFARAVVIWRSAKRITNSHVYNPTAQEGRRESAHPFLSN